MVFGKKGDDLKKNINVLLEKNHLWFMEKLNVSLKIGKIYSRKNSAIRHLPDIQILQFILKFIQQEKPDPAHP